MITTLNITVTQAPVIRTLLVRQGPSLQDVVDQVMAAMGETLVMRLPAAVPVSSLGYEDIPGMAVNLEASSDYEVSGMLFCAASGGTPTTRRMALRMNYTGTLETVSGGANTPLTSGLIYPSSIYGTTGVVLADVSNLDRAVPVTGWLRTGTAGTLTLRGIKMQGTGNPELREGTALVLRKLPPRA